MLTIDNYLDSHYIRRSNWLRAAVLGANDGIISVSSIAIGIAAASSTREPIILATIAGLTAGALSMAAGEYVSVSSQADTEKADIEREKRELEESPEEELLILAAIYEKRGLKKETALKVAEELMEVDPLGAHIRDELGITEMSQAKPLQAALASCGAFSLGGILPLLVTLFCACRNNGVLAIRLYNCLPYYFGRNRCKNRRIKYNQGHDENCSLGHTCYGHIRIGWIYLWS